MGYPKLISFSAATAITLTELVLLVPPAHAKHPIVVTAREPILVRHINYGDLNLTSEAGDRTLRHRVAYAVSDLCNEATGGRDGSMATDLLLGGCERVAWNEARPQIINAEARFRRLVAAGFHDVAAAAVTMTYPQ